MNSTRLWSSTASRLQGGGASGYATSTAPGRKMFSPAADGGGGEGGKRAAKGAFVPVYVAVGMIAMAVAFGAHTVWQQLAHAPGVRVRKKVRETVPEVEEPEKVEEEAGRLQKSSFFRKVAHVQEFDNGIAGDPVRGDAYAHGPKAETLRSVGVDPKLRQ